MLVLKPKLCGRSPENTGKDMNDRNAAWCLLTEFTQSESLRKHALAVEACMRAYARKFGGNEHLWGVVGLIHDFDYEKYPSLSDHPYKGDEIRLISQAIRKTGRPIVLSLSPGPTALDKAEEVTKYAQMWRISDDVWDLWHSDTQFPSGIQNQFARAAKWAPFSGPGHWPDADMLPIGRLAHYG